MVQPGSLTVYMGIGGDVPLSDVIIFFFSFLSMYFLRPFREGMAGLQWDSGNSGSLVHMPLSHTTFISNHRDQFFINFVSFSPSIHYSVYKWHSILIETIHYTSFKKIITHILIGSVNMSEVLKFNLI